MTSSRAILLLGRCRQALLFAGLLLLILGARIFVGVRYLTELPQADDGDTLVWLQKWSVGVHDWAHFWRLHNGVHPMEIYYLVSLGHFLLNGFWDERIDFLVSAFVHMFYAGATMLAFGNVLTRKDRRWIYLFILVLFMVPFAGYRIAWGMLWMDSALMACALAAL